jgi:pyruvate dehydrogenase E1 component alpha subunit
MRSTQDPIQGLKQKILEWGIVSEEDLKSLDKQAKQLVDKEVKEAEDAPFPENTPKILFEDIYVRGSEPDFMKGRTLEETYAAPFSLLYLNI